MSPQAEVSAVTDVSDGHAELASRIDQLLGWAKANKTREYYVMRIENVDRLSEDILKVVQELGLRR